MGATADILTIAEANNGVITSSQAAAAGISRPLLNDLARRGRLERVATGVYILPDVLEDTYFVAQCRYPRGIFSQLSALFLHDLTDLMPFQPYMAFPFGYNTTRPKQAGIQCSSAVEPIYGLGISEAVSPGGHTVRCYSAERTLCDILRPQSPAYSGLIGEAFRRYFARPGSDPAAILSYAEQLHVKDRILPYLEVLA